MNQEALLSVIIPAYNEMENINSAETIISNILEKELIKYEIIFVDDGSTDQTFDEIKNVKKSNGEIKGIRFSRNFGKEAAIQAGLKEAKGDCVAVLDCDLQHPPEVLIEMFQLWEQGYEIIEGVKASRGKENIFHKLGSKFFYSSISRAMGFDMSTSSDFKLIDKRVAKIISELPERNLFFRALTYWVGFRTISVKYDVKERIHGITKWSPTKLFKYAIQNIISFTTAPLHIITTLGILLLLLFFGVGTEALISHIMGKSAEGVTTVILLLLLVGGSVMVSLGIIGLYVGEIYREVKKRPVYLVCERVE